MLPAAGREEKQIAVAAAAAVAAAVQPAAAVTASPLAAAVLAAAAERKKTDNPREGWEDGPPSQVKKFGKFLESFFKFFFVAAFPFGSLSVAVPRSRQGWTRTISPTRTT